MLRVVLAQPRGFCAGVERAIEIVERALRKYGPPIYVRHEIVHNRHVVEDLRTRGAVFVDELDEIPSGAMTIFSAHGVAKRVEDLARDRGLPVIDATCPLVAKVHNEGRRYAGQGREIVLVGHAGHAEVEGTIGQIQGKVHLVQTAADVERLEVGDPEKLAYITQTTLSVDDTRGIIAALKARFPAIIGPDVRDICYATQNRQQAVRELAGVVDMILVVGSRNSSNSNRLREIGEELGKPAYLIDDADALQPGWFEGVELVGVTAGASAPETLVQGVLEGLRQFGEIDISTHEGVAEDVRFRFPAQLPSCGRLKDCGMAVPLNQAIRVGAYVLKQHMIGRKRYPLVLMLEPLFRCNLACAGCGKIDYPAEILNQRLSVAECLEAVDECGAPVVVIAGGEPLLHKEIDQVVEGAVARKKFVIVCTNALLLEKKMHLFKPGPYFTWSVHLDGDREDHDRSVCQDGVYDRAVAAIQAAKQAGFRVIINATLFDNAVPERIAGFFDDVMEMGVDGISVSPGYAYERAPDQQHFLNRRKTKELFRSIFAREGKGKSKRKWAFNQSSMFLDFLAGNQTFHCTPWGNPTRTYFGWQRPCYLLGEGLCEDVSAS